LLARFGCTSADRGATRAEIKMKIKISYGVVALVVYRSLPECATKTRSYYS
jgi:hypothetical protein